MLVRAEERRGGAAAEFLSNTPRKPVRAMARNTRRDRSAQIVCFGAGGDVVKTFASVISRVFYVCEECTHQTVQASRGVALKFPGLSTVVHISAQR